MQILPYSSKGIPGGFICTSPSWLSVTSSRVGSKYKNFWQNLVATFRPLLKSSMYALLNPNWHDLWKKEKWPSSAAPRVESQYKNFWQNLVTTFCPLYPCEKGTKCGDQVLSKIFVFWFYSRVTEVFVVYLVFQLYFVRLIHILLTYKRTVFFIWIISTIVNSIALMLDWNLIIWTLKWERGFQFQQKETENYRFATHFSWDCFSYVLSKRKSTSLFSWWNLDWKYWVPAND